MGTDSISARLGCDGIQTQVLLDLLSDISDRDDSVQRDGSGEPIGGDLHRLLLLLCVHFFVKETMKPDTTDVWPSDYSSNSSPSKMRSQMEPSSPARLTHSWGRDPSGLHGHQWGGLGPGGLPTSPSNLQHIDFLQHQDYIQSGLTEFVGKHGEVFAALVSDGVPSFAHDGIVISEKEIHRLEFLLKKNSSNDNNHNEQEEDSMEMDPMDICSMSPRETLGSRFGGELSSLLDDSSQMKIESLAGWLRRKFCPSSSFKITSNSSSGAELSQSKEEDSPMLGTSPPTVPMFNRLVTTSQITDNEGIYGVNKATVIRGEDDCEDIKRMHVTDCHDAVVYCLAPLKWVSISCCTNSIVVLGAVGSSVRVQRSEKLQVIAVTSHLVVNTCHDCIFYVATNRPPLLLGDNRFIQLAPYNAGYEHLEEHMISCGIEKNRNLWDKPMILMPGHPVYRQHYHSIQQQQLLDHSLNVRSLPPEKLMPFMIPFKGGKGRMCGGAAPSITRGAANDTLTGLLTQDFVEFAPSPFPLPQQYVEAWNKRMDGVNTVRSAYRDAKLTGQQKKEFTSSVQAHFKEWLQSGGGMREVYDLAKVEKQERKRTFS